MEQFAGNGKPLLPEDLGLAAKGASSLLGFLARIFREEISEEFLNELKSTHMQTNLQAVDIKLDQELIDQPANEVLERLAVEYTALFLGPGGHISPHESVQAEENGILMGARTIAVKDFIERSGFGYHDNFNGIPDHISVELEFLSALTHHEGTEWENGNFERAANCLEFEQDFLAKHLGQWVSKFCDTVAGTAEEKLYRDMAELTRDFVLSEIEDVEQRLASARQLVAQQDPVLSGTGVG